MTDARPQGVFVEAVPEGDTLPRLVCADCGFIRYDNPKVVVGAVCVWQAKVLLCRRAIAPRIGFWTIPSGYLELNESTRAGAAREVREEACANVEMGDLIGIYEVPHLSQVMVMYRARMTGPEHAPGVESQEAALFAWDDIPWDDLAFPSVRWGLERFHHDQVLAVVHKPLGDKNPPRPEEARSAVSKDRQLP